MLELTSAVAVRRPAETVLPPGRYVYVGSARRGLDARIAHHLERREKGNWHVVQLTTSPAVRLLGAIRLTGATLTECALNRLVAQAVAGVAAAPGFGSSDDRRRPAAERCPAHLWRCGRPVDPDSIAAALAELGEAGC